MTSPFSFSMDDNDLDDAALWDVIDSAAASHSISASKFQKPLAIRYPNFDSPPTPVSHISPPTKPPQNPNSRYQNQRRQEEPWGSSPHYQRPSKTPRLCASEVRGSADNSHVVVRGASMSPKAMSFSSPESYLSPEIRRFVDGSDASPTAAKCELVESKDEMRHSLSGKFPTVSLFKEYQKAALAILENSDYTMISGKPFIKKSGWRKISFYFNISYEIKDKTIEFDDNRNVQRAEFVIRGHMHGGRFSDGWGSCDRREKKFMKPNNDIPTTAETRAKNRACQDLLGIGEYRTGAS